MVQNGLCHLVGPDAKIYSDSVSFGQWGLSLAQACRRIRLASCTNLKQTRLG